MTDDSDGGDCSSDPPPRATFQTFSTRHVIPFLVAHFDKNVNFWTKNGYLSPVGGNQSGLENVWGDK